mmetsp:Transcript_14322/g.19758  ORF Transcript_14322/g.19758 Transcript_14322/m.19758 type:complete len:243 (-) Transcript_14322:357-1085(-)
MNHPRRLRSQSSIVHRPRAHLFFARCEEVNEVELLIALDNHLGQCRLHALVGLAESGLGFRVRAPVPQILFKLHREGDHDPAAMLLDPGVDLEQPLVLLAHVVLLCEIHEIHHWLGGDKVPQLVDNHVHLHAAPLSVANRLVSLQHGQHLVHGGGEDLRELSALTSLNILSLVFHGFFHVNKILLTQLKLDGLKISHRVNSVIDMAYLRVFKSSHNVEDSVNCLNVRKKGIAKSCTFRRPSN